MSYRDRRSPDRGRERYPAAAPIDSYIPPTSSRASRPRSRSPTGFRPRSRSPARPQGDAWRARPASPPRRLDSRADTYSSRDARSRSPRRDYAPPEVRYDDPSRRVRERSPPPLRRSRDSPPPFSRGGRSPSEVKRERVPSPQRDYAGPKSPTRRAYSPPRDGRGLYRTRSRSPRREERADPYGVQPWRSRSPRREDRADPYRVKSWRRQSRSPRGDSGRNSGATSRSSPRPFNRRPAEPGAPDDSRDAPVSSYRSPARREAPAARPRSPYRDTPYREDGDAPFSRARPPLERDNSANDNGYPLRDSLPPTASSDYRDRPPPTGPAGSSREGPPTGPSGTPLSMSAHNRTPPSGPSYPRGGYGGYRGRGAPLPSRDYPPPRRGPSFGGGANDAYPPRDPAAAFDSRAHTPRRDTNLGGVVGAGPPGFRGSGNSTSTTYPRSQRFNNALSGLPEIKPGGEKLPPLHDTAKADRLEEEAAKLRKMIDEKEMKKRQGLKEWGKMEKESANASLRSELAEEHLRSLNGEGESMAAAF